MGNLQVTRVLYSNKCESAASTVEVRNNVIGKLTLIGANTRFQDWNSHTLFGSYVLLTIIVD